MDLEEFFNKKVEENFDIKSKRISMLDNYGENFQVTSEESKRHENVMYIFMAFSLKVLPPQDF